MYLDLRGTIKKDGAIVEGKRLCMPMPFATRKQQALYDHLRRVNLRPEYVRTEDDREAIHPRLRAIDGERLD